MLIATRALLVASCLTLVAVVGCGGGPTVPSELAGATVTGTVNRSNASTTSGMTAAVVGTNLSASLNDSGQFQITGVPSGNVQLLFRDATVNATVQLSNVGNEELIQLQVMVNGTTATIVNEVRSSGKVSLCHSTGNGSYHLIDVSVNAEPAHRAHGDGAIGERVPGDDTKVFDESCRPVGPAVRIKKSTNGEDADEAPGPTIPVGNPVTWQYVVTNTGTIELTNIVVVDDRIGGITCNGQTRLEVGRSMTCTASGVAVVGQYRNVGTVRADSTRGSVSDSDPSHYFGQAPDTEDGPKVQLCHRTGNGSYHLIEVSINAEPAHRAHGDGKIGELVPSGNGKRFGAGCSVS